MAPVRPSTARQVTPLPISESEPTVAPKSPVDVAAITPHDASDVLTDMPIENGLPGYEAEAEAPVANEGFDHRETPAGEVG
jgi:hypothetical protein